MSSIVIIQLVTSLHICWVRVKVVVTDKLLVKVMAMGMVRIWSRLRLGVEG